MEHYEKKADENLIALKRKTENNMATYKIIAIAYSATLLIAVMVCLICNLAISGSLTWSLIPVSSIVFAWVVFFPGILSGKKGLLFSLIALSLFILPYLFLLSHLINIHEIFTIGSAMALISLAFLWITAAVFLRLGKTKKSAAFGITFLAAIPLIFIYNFTLSKMISEPIFDIWDMLTVFLLLIAAFASFVCGRHS